MRAGTLLQRALRPDILVPGDPFVVEQVLSADHVQLSVQDQLRVPLPLQVHVLKRLVARFVDGGAGKTSDVEHVAKWLVRVRLLVGRRMEWRALVLRVQALLAMLGRNFVGPRVPLLVQELSQVRPNVR